MNAINKVNNKIDDKKYKILLVVNNNTTTGKMCASALQELNHEVILIDTKSIIFQVREHFDMTIVWTNEIPNPNLLSGKKILYYLDDPAFWAKYDRKNLPENYIEKFDYIFTCMRWNGYDLDHFIWLPMGNIPALHNKIELTKEEKETYGCDVAFIGTNRGDRLKLISEIIKNFDSYKIWGNNWEVHNIKTRSVYFEEYNKAINGAKIIISEHYNNIPSTKDCELYAVGGALVINDHPLIKKMYPMAPIYKNYKYAVELAKYYLKHEEERIKLVKQLQMIAYEKFTYKGQLKRMIDMVFHNIPIDDGIFYN